MKNEVEYGELGERFLALLVDVLPAFSILGVILIQRSAERARFGDRVAGTRVIRASSRSP